jgi:hypothetical protein
MSACAERSSAIHVISRAKTQSCALRKPIDGTPFGEPQSFALRNPSGGQSLRAIHSTRYP